MTDDDLDTRLKTLTWLARRVHEFQTQMLQLVVELRKANVSWTKIGAALGTSRQAAWRKYEKEANSGPRTDRLETAGTGEARQENS